MQGGGECLVDCRQEGFNPLCAGSSGAGVRRRSGPSSRRSLVSIPCVRGVAVQEKGTQFLPPTDMPLFQSPMRGE